MSDERYLRWWTSRRDFLAGMFALAGAAVVVAVAIASGAWRHVPGVGSLGEVVPHDLDAACDDRLGRPLKAQDVVAAFEAEGFTMHSLERSFYCNPANFSAGAAVADVSNRRSVTQDDDVVDRQGWITCHVFDDGGDAPYELHADLNRGPDSPIFSGTKAVFDLANVGCSHYPPAVDGRAWTQRAYAAMKRLQRRLASP